MRQRNDKEMKNNKKKASREEGRKGEPWRCSRVVIVGLATTAWGSDEVSERSSSTATSGKEQNKDAKSKKRESVEGKEETDLTWSEQRAGSRCD